MKYSESPEKTIKNDQDILVSVLMPSLNVEPYIRECIESVIHQTLKNIEIICIDAGSTDGTLEILEEYAAVDERIHLIHSKKKSYGHQINLGIDAARGKYLGIAETDDCIEPAMYETLCRIADQNELEILKADYHIFVGDGAERKLTYMPVIEDKHYYNRVLDPFEDDKVFTGKVVPWAGVYNTDFIKQKNIRLNESPGASYQDNGLWWQAFTQAHRVMFYDRPFYNLRRDNPNSSFFSKEKVYSPCDEFDFMRDFMRSNPVLEKRFAALLALYRMKTYDFTLYRIGDEYKREFLERYAADFIKIKENNELDKTLFTEKQWNRLSDIMECPDCIYYRQYYRGEDLIKIIDIQQKKITNQQAELEGIYRSPSFRIGRLITLLPRKLREILQKDSGSNLTAK